MTEGLQSDNWKAVRETFQGMLAFDVVASAERMEMSDSQSSRRDFIRTLFAAIEGIAWQFRENIRALANDLEELTPIVAMALNEMSYTVSDTGKVVEQTRFIALPKMILLSTSVAQSMCPDLKADFCAVGWSNLQSTIAVRNRLAHPKRKSDLNVTTEDITAAWSGLFWLLEHVDAVLGATLAFKVEYISDFKDLVRELKEGNPKTVAQYQAMLRELYG